jgi:Aromatic-ring-opening dioxygenase LigAB, LigA subunit
MSSYHLNRFLFDLKMNESALKRASTDLQGAMSNYDLTAEEKEALRSGDPRRLRPLGAHGMISLYILRLNPKFSANVYWTQK